MVKPASTWEISLIYYQSRKMRNKNNKNNFPLLLPSSQVKHHSQFSLCSPTQWCTGFRHCNHFIIHLYCSFLLRGRLLTLLHCSSMGSLPCWKTALHELLQCESFHWAAIPYEFSRSLSTGYSSSGADCSIVGLLQGHRSCH